MKLLFVGTVVISSLIAQGSPALCETDTKEKSKDGGHLAVKDLPKPLPEIVEGIKRAGDEVGKGVSTAGQADRDAVNNALDKNQQKSKPSDKPR